MRYRVDSRQSITSAFGWWQPGLIVRAGRCAGREVISVVYAGFHIPGSQHVLNQRALPYNRSLERAMALPAGILVALFVAVMLALFVAIRLSAAQRTSR
jgi:hypothetical protein